MINWEKLFHLLTSGQQHERAHGSIYCYKTVQVVMCAEGG